jgi:hypothetical protein
MLDAFPSPDVMNLNTTQTWQKIQDANQQIDSAGILGDNEALESIIRHISQVVLANIDNHPLVSPEEQGMGFPD